MIIDSYNMKIRELKVNAIYDTSFWMVQVVKDRFSNFYIMLGL